ncbi:hypothetical protein DM02DRAFT_541826 [Periconia macrospinosa]|uniref:Isopenicillin N synthase-like Fe(2+) 2OG dioxygenase domain-containing protein n=1 Tax=Periconia macrospinosa TaxID=97972 RepID=A0A2V1D5I9_9PLEO|nr:hypothetical protein DM02DRAFT_541826 [Periconia macrospinosa]
MAVIVTPEHPQRSSRPLISAIIRKLKIRLHPSSKKQPKTTSAPEAEPADDPRPPLNSSWLPLVLKEHQHTLSQLGWTTITFPQFTSPNHALENRADIPPNDSHPLQRASADLFAAAQLFFDQPDEAKRAWKHRLGTEEGWSKVEGEKEFITLRTLEYTPDVLKEAAERYWRLMVGSEGGEGYLRNVVKRVEGSLGLPHHTPKPNPLLQFLPPTPSIPQTDAEKTASMIRIFRYTLSSSTPSPAPTPPQPQPQLPTQEPVSIVAEPHADLGLLSVVTGDVPGLEVWNGQCFVDIERHYVRSGAHAATMLVGRQLEMFSNKRYGAGGHRVPAPDTNATSTQNDKPEPAPKYRHSIVFVLRAHEPVPLDSRDLESAITGKWDDQSFKGNVTAGEVYERIRNAHYNINIGKEERERQKRGVEERRKREAAGS